MVAAVSNQGIVRCALYARRSTDEHQAASLDVQVEEARRFIDSKGWLLATEHIYLEDAVSRAEFKKRPAMLAMLNAASAKQFDIVVTRDETRIGGDMIRTGLVVQDLLDSGTGLYFYFTGEEVRLDDATQKFIMAAKNFASELEREKISQRTREHLENKARRGLNVGGKVYGYDNIEVKEDNIRLRVEYRINKEQAAVVVEIFQRYVAGDGYKAICKELNGRHVPSPWAGKRGTGSWAPSMVREVLLRERYLGKLVWGRMRKMYKGGTKVRVQQEESSLVTVDAPHLRIIDDELWFAAQAQRTERTRGTGGNAHCGREPRYLLTNILRCAECGGPIQAALGKSGSERMPMYLCGYHRTRGAEVCSNSVRRPVHIVDGVVLGWVAKNILAEDIVLDVIAGARKRLKEEMAGKQGELPALEAEERRLRREVARLVDVLAASADKADGIVKGIAERNERLKEVDARIRVARLAPGRIDADLGRFEATVRERLDQLREMLGRNVLEGRKLLLQIFPAPIIVTPLRTPHGALFDMIGTAQIAPVFFACETQKFTKRASPGGFETYQR